MPHLFSFLRVSVLVHERMRNRTSLKKKRWVLRTLSQCVNLNLTLQLQASPRLLQLRLCCARPVVENNIRISTCPMSMRRVVSMDLPQSITEDQSGHHMQSFTCMAEGGASQMRRAESDRIRNLEVQKLQVGRILPRPIWIVPIDEVF